MMKEINFNETLNEREKYILETLEVDIRNLVPEKYFNELEIMNRMIYRISQIPITREQFIIALDNYEVPHKDLFKGIKFIVSDKDYPNETVNMSKILSKNNKKIIKLLGMKVKNKEISSKEYLENLNFLVNKILMKFGTGIKLKECYRLMNKIEKVFA